MCYICYSVLFFRFVSFFFFYSAVYLVVGDDGFHSTRCSGGIKKKTKIIIGCWNEHHRAEAMNWSFVNFFFSFFASNFMFDLNFSVWNRNIFKFFGAKKKEINNWKWNVSHHFSNEENSISNTSNAKMFCTFRTDLFFFFLDLA